MREKILIKGVEVDVEYYDFSHEEVVHMLKEASKDHEELDMLQSEVTIHGDILKVIKEWFIVQNKKRAIRKKIDFKNYRMCFPGTLADDLIVWHLDIIEKVKDKIYIVEATPEDFSRFLKINEELSGEVTEIK